MNKLHVLALTGLMVCGVHNVSAMGQEQREVLYALHTLGQNIADVPMIVQNIDMFMGVLEMNIQINEAKLKAANQKMKTTIMNSAAMFAGTWISAFAMSNIEMFVFDNLPSKVRGALPTHILGNFIHDGIGAGLCLSKVIIGLNIHDAWKNRSALMEALALDKEILNTLEEIKVSMEFIEENSDAAESFLLNDVE